MAINNQRDLRGFLSLNRNIIKRNKVLVVDKPTTDTDNPQSPSPHPAQSGQTMPSYLPGTRLPVLQPPPPLPAPASPRVLQQTHS